MAVIVVIATDFLSSFTCVSKKVNLSTNGGGGGGLPALTFQFAVILFVVKL